MWSQKKLTDIIRRKFLGKDASYTNSFCWHRAISSRSPKCVSLMLSFFQPSLHCISLHNLRNVGSSEGHGIIRSQHHSYHCSPSWEGFFLHGRGKWGSLVSLHVSHIFAPLHSPVLAFHDSWFQAVDSAHLFWPEPILLGCSDFSPWAKHILLSTAAGDIRNTAVFST